MMKTVESIHPNSLPENWQRKCWTKKFCPVSRRIGFLPKKIVIWTSNPQVTANTVVYVFAEKNLLTTKIQETFYFNINKY